MPITCVKLSQSYLYSVSAYDDCSIKVYNNEICEIQSDFKEHENHVKHLYILGENKKVLKILSADGNDHIKVWLARNGQLLDSIIVPCKIMCCSPGNGENNYIVSGNGENT